MLSFYILSQGMIPVALPTLFAPVTVQEKVEDSDAVILGIVAGAHFKKDDKGVIMTEVTLDVKKSVGLQFNQIVSKKSFKVRYPGGEWGGLVQKIEGTPRFKTGEEVILLLRHRKNVFWIHHLAAGKFSKMMRDGQEFLISPIFSDLMGVGLISFFDFQKILEESHLKSSLSYIPSEKHAVIAQEKKERSRNLATDSGPIYSEADNDFSGPTFNLVFLIFILLLVGFLYIFMTKHRGHK